jgi:hypothetical protein
MHDNLELLAYFAVGRHRGNRKEKKQMKERKGRREGKGKGSTNSMSPGV